MAARLMAIRSGELSPGFCDECEKTLEPGFDEDLAPSTGMCPECQEISRQKNRRQRQLKVDAVRSRYPHLVSNKAEDGYYIRDEPKTCAKCGNEALYGSTSWLGNWLCWECDTPEPDDW